MERTLSWVKAVLDSEGRLVASDLAGHDDEPWFGATVDTRAECTHRIFFALRGDRTDGHRFVEEARVKGCSAVVVDDEGAARALSRAGTPFFRVPRALDALQELSRAHRDTLDTRVVAVTGSMGKTTTKEYIRAILKKKYRVHSNPGNLNNHIGVPLTLLETDDDNEYLVCEIAANHVGEIEFLSRLLRPDIGVVTNIGDAHIGYFGSRDKIAEAKSEIFTGIDHEGYAVLPADDAFIDTLRGKAECRVVTFGRAESSTYVVSGVNEEPERISFAINGEPMEVKGIGAYNALNAGAAYAVAELCGVELDRIRGALLETEPIAGRAKLHRGRGVVLIDDSYNANPTSMRAAIDSLGRVGGSRRIAVLGDMAELGAFSDSAHRELGAYIAGGAVDVLYWYGENGRLVEEGFSSRKAKKEFRSYRRIDELIRDLKRVIGTGDVVLVKASRACHLDEVVDGLVETVVEKGKD
jgi:UDP-N-acetylmuramoyl-tripeptide--D-alanyl-D-alanine ligase